MLYENLVSCSKDFEFLTVANKILIFIALIVTAINPKYNLY